MRTLSILWVSCCMMLNCHAFTVNNLSEHPVTVEYTSSDWWTIPSETIQPQTPVVNIYIDNPKFIEYRFKLLDPQTLKPLPESWEIYATREAAFEFKAQGDRTVLTINNRPVI